MEELLCISPIDGRYHKTTEKLNEYFSEYALIKYRVIVEIKWLLKLNEIININFSKEQIGSLNSIIDNFNTIGLKEKLNYFNYNDKVNLYEKNFFEQKVEKECDFLFCYKSLHLNCNKHIPKERKMKKLLSSVKENALNHKLYPFLQYSNLNY